MAHQRTELARGDPGVRVVGHDPRGEREHPQQGQRPEDREPVLLEVAEEPEHLFAFALQHRVIKTPMRRLEFDCEHLLLLLRQIRCDEVLRSPKHEWPQPRPSDPCGSDGPDSIGRT